MTRLQWKRTKTRVSLDIRKNPAYGRSSFYSFSSKDVTSKAGQEVGTSRGLRVAQERHSFTETSLSGSSAFAANCKHGYQQCPMILWTFVFDLFSSWEWGRKCLLQASSRSLEQLWWEVGGCRLAAAFVLLQQLPHRHSGQAKVPLFHFPVPTGFRQAVSELRESCRAEPSQKRAEEKLKTHTSFLQAC